MIELNEIRGLARDFAQAELRPGVERWDHDRALGENVLPQLAELGFLGMVVAEEDGGMGFDMPAFAAALEELAWGEPATALLVLAQQIVASGLAGAPADVRKRWLEPLAAGTLRGCYVLGDEASLHASQAGDAWRVSGSAPWVLHAGDGAALALARAGLDGGAGMFAVALDDGARFGERADTLGLRPLHVAPLLLEAAAAVRLGDDAGAAASRTGRLGVAAIALGIAQAALDHALGYAAQREQFNTKLREFDAIRLKLADMAVRIAATRALLLEAAQQDALTAAGMAKVLASQTAMHVTTEAVQIFGGYGYMRDYPVEKLMRDARAMGLLQGPDERVRLEIAVALYDD